MKSIVQAKVEREREKRKRTEIETQGRIIMQTQQYAHEERQSLVEQENLRLRMEVLRMQMQAQQGGQWGASPVGQRTPEGGSLHDQVPSFSGQQGPAFPANFYSEHGGLSGQQDGSGYHGAF